MTAHPLSASTKCREIQFRTVRDARGALSVAQGGAEVPFAIARAFWLYGSSERVMRGHHAHRACRQLLVPIAGSIDVAIDEGNDKIELTLDDPGRGLLVDPVTWCELWLSPGSVCLVLASHGYDESDYIRDYSEFLRTVKAAP